MPLPQIKINNDLFQNTLLSSVEVVQELNQHWKCTIVCRQTQGNRLLVEELLSKTVEIQTVDDGGVEHLHFSGFVLDVEVVYEVYGSYTTRIVAVSSSYKLDITAHKQYYAEKNLSDIAGIIAGRSGLSVSVNASSSKALNYVQYGETDFSFLSRIVDDYGAWMRPNQAGVEIFDSFQFCTTVTWRQEGDLLEFSLQGKMAPSNFSGAHYDHHAMASNTFTQISKPPSFYDGGQSLSGAVQSASQQLPPGFEPQRARAMTLSDYQTQLQQESERSLGAAITGAGWSRNQNLKAGNSVQVDGVLDAKGTYGLVKVIHQWTKKGYSNRFVCTPWKQYRNPLPPPARTWNGVVPARVVDHNDPKKMGRIKIQFFWQDDGSTHWARAVSPHAGPDRGFMFMPEVGDEVAVIFEDGDPERPLIIGSVWNGVQQAPREDYYGSDIPANDIKRVLTKSGNRMQFVDTENQEAVVLATPNSNSFTMTEHSLDTGRKMIALHTEGDIILSAAGRIHLKAALLSHEIGGSGGTKSS
jgi:type VI secretion system secreted protein VgrG